MGDRPEDDPGEGQRQGAWSPRPAVVLAVDADAVLDALPPVPETTRVVRARFRELGAGLIARTLPDCIVAPLIAADFDAVELAHRICGYGYRGRLVVCAPDLPNRKLVRRELAGACEGLEVDLVELA